MNNPQKIKVAKRQLRKARVRSVVTGTKDVPRLSVFKSLKHVRVQLIDDTEGKTLAEASDKSLKGSKTEKSIAVGKLIADKAKALKIEKCIFDRGGSKYHGRIKAVADAAREAGLQF